MSSVMPKQSLSMEQIYDDSGKAHSKNVLSSSQEKTSRSQTTSMEDDLKTIRAETSKISVQQLNIPSENISAQNSLQSFHKVLNPTLKLYVYPHLAGNDELPVPGYTTAFNAYEKDHYLLPTD
jgi:conjugative transfer region lipoprotein (TIGR03751 family)